MTINTYKLMYEDELPTLTDAQFALWYSLSWVNRVRVGYDVSDTDNVALTEIRVVDSIGKIRIFKEEV
jgi:hypothetical protein